MSRPTADDLLSFKEFEPVHGDNSGSGGYSARGGGRAEININSPKRDNQQQQQQLGSAFDENFGQLIDDMSTSVNMMDDNTNRTLPPSTSGATSLDDDASPNADKPANYSFFTIEYYQQFFDVDTNIVCERILNSVVPRRASATYLRQNIAKNPDLYGPFWIVVTLIFCIAISGNVASYLQTASNDYEWRYNFHLVSTAATTIVMYVCLVPVGLWAAFKWFVRPSDPDIETESPYIPGLLTLICVYGYSLVIYIPVSILWVIQVSALQWLLVLSATFLSGSVLVLVLTPALRVARGSMMFAVGIVAAHFLLAAGFMLYFFHGPNATEVITPIVAAAAAAVAPAAVVVAPAAVTVAGAAAAAHV